MKRLCFILLSLLLLLTACYTPAMEVTPKPTLPADTPQVVSPTPLPTPEPTPASTPFLSYEEYFSQRIYYGSEMDDDGLFERHLSHNKEDISPGVALAQELVAKDPLGMIPKTLEWVADRCLYAFWAGGEEGLIFYRLYAPSRTLECLYTVPEEDLENYFYTPQTEIVADWLGGQVGMKICLIRNVSLYSNYEYLWWAHNKKFLEHFDCVAADPEAYLEVISRTEWPGLDGDLYDVVHCIEGSCGCYNSLTFYINADSGQQASREEGVYPYYGPWWEL